MTRFLSCPFADSKQSAWPGWWLMPLLVAMAPPAPAVDWGADLQLHGFLTQGFVKTSDNRFFGDSDDGSFDFTELGVNTSYRASPAVLLSGQLLSRRAGDMYEGAPVIDYALIDWNLVHGPQRAYGFMLGRIKNPLGLYNDTRDVAFTRPSIFVPQQIYFDKVRNLVLSADGIQLYGSLYTAVGNWTANLGAGKNRVDENVEITFLGTDLGGELDASGPALFANVEYETPDGAWRLGLSGAKTTLEFDAVPSDLLLGIGSGEIDLVYWIASVQYNAERWGLTAEYMEEPVDFKDFGLAYDSNDGTVQGYYLQGSYLLRDEVELLVRYSEGFTDKDDRDGRRQSAAAGGAVPSHAFFQKDWMVGLRWDVTPRFMLRAEYQWNRGTWTLAPRENPVPSASVKDWEMCSLLASYRF